MTGVEILSSSQVAIGHTFNWNAFLITVGIMLGLGLIVGIIGWIFTGEWKAALASLCICGILGVWLGSIISGENGVPTAHETHYKVIIDDSVSMNEFLDKYEILDQEGKIYTVKEKEG